MNQDKRARAIIHEVLNLALNRHAHVLSDAGYLRKKKYYDDYGYRDSLPLPALKLKHELMAEIADRLAPAIADFVDDTRENMWPMRDEPIDERKTRSQNDLE